MRDLVKTSIDVILAGQHSSGAFMASPTFPQYRYSWIRDGSFVAYGLDRAGRHTEARRFHRWVAETVLAHRDHAKTAIANVEADERPGDYLPCRYTLDGQIHDDDWPSFQLDGYGTWIWSLAEHVTLAPRPDELSAAEREAIDLLISYLSTLWPEPCYDCWEEHGDRVHPATLACLHGGLTAASRLTGNDAAAATANQVRQRVLEASRQLGRIPKHLNDRTHVDASLLWCATPFGMIQPHDPVMVATLDEVERQCVDPDGGVHRYRADTYYGGGAWPLLTAWLGWHYSRIGRVEQAHQALANAAASADADGLMPEQTATHLLDPSHIPEWEQRWGRSAHPLLWTHAMYLVLHAELRP